METITVEVRDTIAIVKLNRPNVLNSMTEQMSIDARQALADIRQNNIIRAMILTAEGRSFCAGAELNDELSGGDAQHSAGSRLNATMRDHTNPWIHDLHNMPIPVVVAINGVAAGAGVGLALAGDISIAANSAAFVLTFSAKLGLIPDVGLTGVPHAATVKSLSTTLTSTSLLNATMGSTKSKKRIFKTSSPSSSESSTKVIVVLVVF